MPGVEISLMQEVDIDEVRHMQALVWQDHFLQERGKQVPLLYRSRQNLKYYLTKEGNKSFVARLDGVIIGSIICHTWGSIGWFGPLEVLPQYQGQGIGKELVGIGMDFLDSQGCNITGLETMSSSARNVGFYTKQGFRPQKHSYVLFKDLSQIGNGNVYPPETPRMIEGYDIESMKKIWNIIEPGLDYSSEIESTRKHDLGDVWMFKGEGDFPNHVILHTYELIDGSMNTIVKLLVAENREMGKRMVEWCMYHSSQIGKMGMFLRFYEENALTLQDLLDMDFTLNGTLVRMLMKGESQDTDMVHISCWSG